MKLFILASLLFASALAQTEYDWGELADELDLLHLLADPVEGDGETAVGGESGNLDSFETLMQDIMEDDPVKGTVEKSVGGDTFAMETQRIKQLLRKAGLVDSQPPAYAYP